MRLDEVPAEGREAAVAPAGAPAVLDLMPLALYPRTAIAWYPRTEPEASAWVNVESLVFSHVEGAVYRDRDADRLVVGQGGLDRGLGGGARPGAGEQGGVRRDLCSAALARSAVVGWVR